MGIAGIGIRRPVFVIMVMVFFVVVGLVSYSRLGMNMFPKVVFPFITVTTIYPGASPDVVESEVTKKLEDSIAVIEGIDRLSSYSQESASLVFVRFDEGIDVDVAAQDIRDKVELVKSELPDGAEEPIVSKVDINAMPIMHYTVSSDTMGLRELRDYVDRYVADVLQQARGVADVEVTGGLEREIRVVLEPERLEAHGIDPTSVGRMIAASNIDFPVGSVKQGGLDYILRVPSEYSSVDEMSSTVIATVAGQTVRLGDIATILDTEKERTTDARRDGKSAVLLSVILRGDADLASTAANIKRRAEILRHALPPGVKLTLVYDYSKWVTASLSDINTTILFGAILASFVVWLFIGKMRFTIPITMSILVSVVGAYAAINFAGFTLNFMSMLALAVAIGLLVDDAIVVQENLIREYENTGDITHATVVGTQQVMLAVLASTTTIIAVFLPIAFMSGIIGQFFKEFGVTIAFAIGISTVVALLLIPLVFYHSDYWIARLSRKQNSGSFLAWLSRLLDPIHQSFLSVYGRVENWYGRFLRTALRRRASVIVVALGVFLCAIPLFMLVQVSLEPDFDAGQFVINVELPVEATLERTDGIVKQVEQAAMGVPETESVLSVVGMTFGGFMGNQNQSNLAMLFCKMKDKDERQLRLRWWGIIPVPYKYSPQDLVEIAREHVSGIAGAKITVSAGQEEAGHPVELVFSDHDYDRLKRVTRRAQELLAAIPGTISVDNSERTGKLELRIKPRLTEMSHLGITPVELGQYLRILYEGEEFSTYREDGEEYDITLQLPEALRHDLQSVKSLKILSPRLGEPVALETIADIELAQGPSIIQHSDRVRSINVYADVERGVGSGNVLAQWRAAMSREDVIPRTTTVTAIGEADMIGDMFRQFLLALFLGILFSYMVLASLFNSFKHPLIIQLSVPLATTGALLFIVVTGKSFNLMSFLGIIMLTGLVTKNAILLIDFANQARAKGESVESALVLAGLRRMRPILMTSFTTVAALLPVAFGLGEGADFRSPLAVAVIGGMIFSTALTLVVIPAVYSLVEGRGGGPPAPKPEPAAVE